MAKQTKLGSLFALLCAAILLAAQLAACEESAESASKEKNDGAASEQAKQLGLPLLVIRQDSSSSKKPTPDFFLIWLQPYEELIPKQIMDLLNQQVRPQTEQISQQVLTNVPGGEQIWSQISGLQASINNAGGLSSVLGDATGASGASNPFAGLLGGFGRRRRR